MVVEENNMGKKNVDVIKKRRKSIEIGEVIEKKDRVGNGRKIKSLRK